MKLESHKIFMNMFPSDDGTNTPQKKGLLDWRKFVDAMTDAGFSASGSGGSAIIFANDNGGKIIFHRPHPVTKVDQSMLTWLSKRLRKRFGMDRKSFELAERRAG